MSALVGRALAIAVHQVCRGLDPQQAGASIADIEAAAVANGVEIGGKVPRQTLSSAMNNAQDLFKWVSTGRWTWIEPGSAPTVGLSGLALAEEAYRIAMRSDPERQGLDYEALKALLVEAGVIIKGPSPGRTVYRSLVAAKRWFDLVSSGVFRWKL